MRTISALIAAIAIPLGLLNMFGGIVAGIWLAILGEWAVIALGIGILFVGAFAVSLLLMPGMGVAAFGIAVLDRGNRFVGWTLILLASPWTYVVIITWEIGMFLVFGRHVTSDNAIPMWLWTYGAATGVWSYLASKERQSGDDGGAAMTAFAAQIAFIVLSVCLIWGGWSLVETAIAMAVPLLLPLALGLLAIGISSRRYT